MRYKFICLVAVAMCTIVFGLNVDTRAADSTSFIRMFPDLPPVLPPNNASRDLVKQVGARLRITDSLYLLTDPIQSITNPSVFSPNNPDNPNMTAGMTFLGQFLDHDITFDPNSLLSINGNIN